MSGMIISSHVKEGVELANQHKLPQPIIDIIEQHHGTSLMTFFTRRQKARETRTSLLKKNINIRGLNLRRA